MKGIAAVVITVVMALVSIGLGARLQNMLIGIIFAICCLGGIAYYVSDK